MIHQFISDEKFTNVQRAQAGLTKLFADAHESKSFYRVLKNDQPLGVLIPNSMWESIIEDFEAISSPNYLKRIAKARKSKKRYTLEEIKKEFEVKQSLSSLSATAAKFIAEYQPYKLEQAQLAAEAPRLVNQSPQPLQT